MESTILEWHAVGEPMTGSTCLVFHHGILYKVTYDGPAFGTFSDGGVVQFSIDEIDVLFVGRLDLSVSLGIPGQVEHLKINEVMHEVIFQARAAGKAIGIGAVDERKPERIREFIDQGVLFFSLNTTSILTGGAREALQKIKGTSRIHNTFSNT